MCLHHWGALVSMEGTIWMGPQYDCHTQRYTLASPTSLKIHRAGLVLWWFPNSCSL